MKLRSTLIILVFFSHYSYAAILSEAKFFSSNNTQIIDPHRAYERLVSDDQENLKNEIIKIMQKNHLEQNQNEDVLGIYKMESDQNVTADNTEIFTTSPYQSIREEHIFDIAKQLAISLKQESVLVFIPNKADTIAEVTVNFDEHPLSITEVIDIVKKKLPIQYSQAYTIYLKQKNAGYDATHVSRIEWLGSQIKPTLIKSAFPNNFISSNSGKAFLIFKNGQKQEL